MLEGRGVEDTLAYYRAVLQSRYRDIETNAIERVDPEVVLKRRRVKS